MELLLDKYCINDYTCYRQLKKLKEITMQREKQYITRWIYKTFNAWAMRTDTHKMFFIGSYDNCIIQERCHGGTPTEEYKQLWKTN